MSAATTPRCNPAVTRMCTVPVSWNSSCNSGGIAERSPHNSPATTDACGSGKYVRNCANAQPCIRASTLSNVSDCAGNTRNICALARCASRPRSRSISRWLGSPGFRGSSKGSMRPRSSTWAPSGGGLPKALTRTRGPLSSTQVKERLASPSPVPLRPPARRRALRRCSGRCAFR